METKNKSITIASMILLLALSAAAQSDLKTKLDANLMFTRTAINRCIDDPKNSCSDDIQKLLFEPEVWKVELAKVIGATPSQFPSDWASPIQQKIDELRGLIDTSGKTRGWTAPPWNRPVEQNMAKAKFLAYYKGAQVLKIGSNYKDWNTFKNSLGIPTNRFIRGVALLKIPNRPYCQAQEWIVRQKYAGGWSASTVDSFGGGGMFMKCE